MGTIKLLLIKRGISWGIEGTIKLKVIIQLLELLLGVATLLCDK